MAETHKNLGRSSGHVDRHQGVRVVLHEHLGRRHPLVTRTEYLVHLRHGLRAIRKRCDRLGASRLEDGRRADEMRDVHHFGRDAAVWAGWRGEDDLPAAGDLCGDAEHECRGWQDGRAAGDVEPDARDGTREARADDAGRRLDHQRVRARLCLVELADVGVCDVDRGADGGVELQRFGRKGRAEDRAVEAGLVVFGCQVEERGVAVGAHVVHDGLDLGNHGIELEHGATKKLGTFRRGKG